jgi:alpha-1,3-rhamnosyl/mannosyltransferase
VRVLINQTSTFGKKTGVGHHTAELLRGLARQGGADQFNTFPPRWLGAVREVGRWVRSQLLSGAGGVPAARQDFSTPPAGLRGVFFHLGRKCNRRLNQCLFRRAQARNDIYHEPNFIPLNLDLPTVITIHDLSVLLHPEWHPADRVAYFEKEFYRGLRQAEHFLAVSESGRQEIIHTLHLPPEKVTRTYNGIRPGLGPMAPEQVERILRRLKLPSRYLLYLGTIEPRKNVLRLLKAYCGLPQRLRSAWPLLLVGSWGWNTGPVSEYFHQEARHRGVLYLGYIADRDLPALYNGARALVYPSLYEGFGLPPLEMMACGGAVLASTAESIVETAGPKAHLIDPEDVDGWRASLARVVEDEEWWQSLREGATEVARRFTWDRCAADTLRVYRQVAGLGSDVPAPMPRAA